MLTFKDLVLSVELEDVKNSILQLYPDQDVNLEGYESVFNTLRQMKPIKTNEDWIIELKPFQSMFDGEMLWDVSGLWLNSTDPELCWSLRYTSWAEWLAFEIKTNQLELMSKEDYLAHCLYEMTYCGFDEEAIKRSGDDLSKAITDKITEEGFEIDSSIGDAISEKVNDLLPDFKVEDFFK